ncbi:MAG: hypothetical protein NZ839_03280 [Endomicrobia bacterium]|nr:hypothetical protein [Endomicrobiia bacterium]
MEILNDWNFWKKDLPVGYILYKETPILTLQRNYLKNNLIVCFSGVRRSGKSYLMRQLAKRLIEKLTTKNLRYRCRVSKQYRF